uniref:Uncharacterized protein n=1 Tax=Anguilla anguilla TaxID=7936 RepID=A0A0E9QIV6_ANGAN
MSFVYSASVELTSTSLIGFSASLSALLVSLVFFSSSSLAFSIFLLFCFPHFLRHFK